MKWIDLTTAPDPLTAEIWCDVLIRQGISAQIRPSDTASFLGVSSYPTGVLVEETQLEQAKGILENGLGES